MHLDLGLYGRIFAFVEKLANDPLLALAPVTQEARDLRRLLAAPTERPATKDDLLRVATFLREAAEDL